MPQVQAHEGIQPLRRRLPLAALLLAGLLAGQAARADMVGLPFYVDVEGAAQRTTACLVVDRVPLVSGSLPAMARSADGAQRALARTLGLLAAGDAERVQAEAAPAAGRATMATKDQIGLYVQQMRKLQASAVSQAYAFDGYTVFYVEFKGKDSAQSLLAPLSFTTAGGDFRFLPDRPTSAAFAFLDYTVRSAERERAAPATAAAAAASCQGDAWTRLSHRLPLSSDGQPGPKVPLLAFAGVAASDAGSGPQPLREIEGLLERVRKVGAGGQFDDAASLMSLESWARVKQAAGTPDANSFLAEIKDYKLVFVADMGALNFVYAHAPAGPLRVLTLRRLASGWQWANVNRSHYTSNFLGTSRLLKLAQESPPFASVLAAPAKR
jgi:hypothetical protein